MGFEYKSETWAVVLLLRNVVPANPLIANVIMKAAMFPQRNKKVFDLSKENHQFTFCLFEYIRFYAFEKSKALAA